MQCCQEYLKAKDNVHVESVLEPGHRKVSWKTTRFSHVELGFEVISYIDAFFFNSTTNYLLNIDIFILFSVTTRFFRSCVNSESLFFLAECQSSEQLIFCSSYIHSNNNIVKSSSHNDFEWSRSMQFIISINSLCLSNAQIHSEEDSTDHLIKRVNDLIISSLRIVTLQQT